MSDIKIFIPDKDNEGEWRDFDEGLLDLSSHDAKVRADGYNKAIDDFSTDIINKINFEDKWLFDCKSNNADTDIAFSALRTFVNERAEQLKAGGAE